MAPLEGKIAVVTGASRGIGRAVAVRLAGRGVELVLAGRDTGRLNETQAEITASGGRASVVALDLADAASIEECVREVGNRWEPIHLLLNCAGAYARAGWQSTSPQLFEKLWRTNVQGASVLTRALLPALIRARGDIVFVSSSIVAADGASAGAYAATKHALRGLADSLRAEVNEQGVRVLTIYPGRTATPLQQQIHREEGREYRPERLLQADDVASAITACLELPATAEVTDLSIRQRFKS